MSNLKAIILEMVDSYLAESSDFYGHHAAVVKLPDGNHAIIGASKNSFEDAKKNARDKGLVKMHAGKDLKHFKISKAGYTAFQSVGFDHDEDNAYDHKKWSFDSETGIAQHNSEKYKTKSMAPAAK